MADSSEMLAPTADQVTTATPSVELLRRRRASRAAAVVAVVVLLLALVLIARAENENTPSTKQTTITESSNSAGKAGTVKETKSTEVTSRGTDASFLGRTLGSGAGPILLQLLVAAAVAFAAGAFVQRVWLGEYGITVGPVSLPALAAVTNEAATEVEELIRESPEVLALAQGGPRGPQPYPQFYSIDDPQLSLVSIRIELEERLRDLAESVGLDRDIALLKIPARLSKEGVLDTQAARGLRQLVELGDRIVAGAQVEPQADERIRHAADVALYALGELRRRAMEGRVP
ncbi:MULTISPECIES: hypothetical protein [unclassified Kribbella]|uniref:hypothetical protein n=1 Tax=unclassified Kribbella TaxID=2644121 RepID=UPI0030787870